MPLALLAAVAAGAAISGQAFLLGRLGRELGSPALAAAINSVVALIAVGTLALASGAALRAGRRVRAGSRPRWWHVLAGLNGALFLYVGAVAAPVVGISLLTVVLVCGQLLAGVVLDAVGAGPGGVRPLTLARAAGAALAVLAVAVNVGGTGGLPPAWTLALGVVAGACVALQGVALGQMARITGEPSISATINFLVGGAATVTIALVATGGTAPLGWHAPPGLWLSGLLAAGGAIAAAWAIQALGAVRMALSLIAGQTLGALALDLLAPAHRAVSPAAVASVLLTFAAVAVSAGRGMASRSARGAT